MKEIVERDAKEAVDILSGAIKAPRDIDYGTYSQIVLFSNENLEGTASNLSYKNKSVLAVTSSGDQFLAAKYFGADKVDLFDINRFTYYITCLKIVAVQHLSYYQFLNFFVPPYMFEPNKHFFEVSTLEYLIPFMSSEVAYFWQQVIINNENKPNINIGRLVNLYDLACDEGGIKNGSPFYENKDNYIELQKKVIDIEMPKFIETDLLKIKSVLVDSYDVVYLSNIIFRLSESNNNADELGYFRRILEQLKDHLNDNCKIMVNYYCNFRKEQVGFETDSIEKVTFISKYLPYNDDFYEVDSDVALIYTHKN